MGMIDTLLKTYSSRILRSVDKWANRQWFVNPLARTPIAEPSHYLALASNVRNEAYPEVDRFEKICNAAIDLNWLDNVALHTQVVIKKSPLCYAHGRVLYSSLSAWLRTHSSDSTTDRITVLETGTARGFSALCMAKAMNDQQRSGSILTFDVLPHTIPMYWNCIDDGDRKKTRAELLQPWNKLVENYIVFNQGDTRIMLPKVRCSRIHFAFLDGAHTYDDVMFEFMQVAPFQQAGDVIVYDDYNQTQFPGLVKAVDEICTQQGYDRIDIYAHKDRGYVVAKKR
jgi:predicted O-methyltransferase YrrM